MHRTNCYLPLQAQQDTTLPKFKAPAIKLGITSGGVQAFSWPDLDRVMQAQDLQWGTVTWAKASTALHDAILEGLRNLLGSDIYLQHLQQSLNPPFKPDEHSQLKLQRFQTVHTLLDNELLPRLVRQTLSSRMAKLEDMVNDLFSSHSGGILPPDAFAALERRIEGHTLQEMLALLSSLGHCSTIPAGFQLTEDARTAAARAGLADRVDKLQSARHTINQIAGFPASGSYAASVKAESDSKLGSNGPDYDKNQGMETGAFCGFVWPGDDLAMSMGLYR